MPVLRSPAPSRSQSGELVTVQLTQLKVGAILHAPIYDAHSDKSPLLLSAGSELTIGQIRALERRGVTQVRIHVHEVERVTDEARAPNALSAHQRDVLRQAARHAQSQPVTRKPAVAGWRCERDSFLNEVRPPAGLERNEQTAAEFERTYENQVRATSTMFREFTESGKVNAKLVEDIAVEQLREMAADLDEFLSRGLRPIHSDYPSRHSLQCAMLASSIGMTMGLRKDDLVELSFGCLLHDAGMLLVPEHLRLNDGPLDIGDRLEVQKHPTYAADLLANRNDISHAAKMVVYQMHERMNGSGYPRQRQGQQIHLFARIAAVADTYLAMISPRTYRDGLEPYQAVEKLLFATRKGLFDPSVVRGLLHTVSLFPIGSHVQLSDGRIGRVIRGNRDHFARPVVEVVDSSGELPAVEIIDLSKMPELSVSGTVDASALPWLTK
jgi:HD-GYP domain-containing protein (c-di-GMP phosphodiesterase class II)